MHLAWVAPTALAAALLCAAQEPVFRAGTRLVEVSVTVLDRKGNPVTGLRAEDFTVHDEGEPRPVAFLQFDGAPSTPPAHSAPPGVFTNMVEYAGGAPRNISALVLDGLNTPPEHNMRVRAHVMRYLKALPPDTRIAIYHMGRGLRVLHDFANDPDSLRERIAKARLEIPLETVADQRSLVLEAEQLAEALGGDAAATQMAQDQLEMEMAANAAARRRRMERTLAAMELLARHLAGIPGRKSLVWITSGFSMVSIQGAMGFGPHGDFQNYEEQVRDTSRRLAQRGISLYIVDAAGLENQAALPASFGRALPLRGQGRFERQMDAEAINNDPYSAMSLMASVTGGRYIVNTNDLNTGFRRAVADLEGSYTLAFYAPESGDGKWHKLRVRVAHPDARVHHREGYFAESLAAPQPEWNDDSWRTAAASPLGSSAIRFLVACRRDPDGTLVFRMRIAAACLRFRREAEGARAALEVMIAGRSPEGRLWTSHRNVNVTLAPEIEARLQNAAVPVVRAWKPDPAVRTVRIIVRDKTAGQYGTVDVPLARVAPPAHAEP